MTLIESLRASSKAMTAPELAERLSLSKKSIYKYVERGTIPYFRFRTSIRFDPKEIADWLEQRHIP